MTPTLKWAIFTSLLSGAVSCAPENSARIADTAAPTVAPATPAFTLALMNQASQREAAAFKLVAFTTQAIDPATVKFCFDTLANCSAGLGAVLPGLAQDAGSGRKVFLSDKFVKLSANLNVTVMAKDATGFSVSTGLKIVEKGASGAVPTAPSNVLPGASPSLPPSPSIAPPAATASDCYKAPSDFICQVEKECVRLTNEKRATEGKGALAFNKEMGYVSRLWSQAQADRGSIGHDWFESGTWDQKYRDEFKNQSPSRGENVAMNGGVDESTPTAVASALIEQWWASPGHHANMVGGYGIMSCGYAKGGDGWYGTQNFGN